jgi:hypothetical protein
VTDARPPEGPDRDALVAAMIDAAERRDDETTPFYEALADAVLALLPTPPAPAEGPDREALRDFLRLSMSEANVQHALALLPTPPAPGGGEGLRADPVETLCAEWEHLAASGRAPSWSVPASLLRAALAARDTDQGARDALAEVRVLSAAASPGEWTYHVIDSVAGGMIYDATRTIGGVYYEQPDDHDGRIVRHLLVPEADANGALIVAAVNYVRAALARATPEAGEGKL